MSTRSAIREIKTGRILSRFACLAFILLTICWLSACGGASKQEGAKGAGESSPATTAATRPLVYGVSVVLPQGWVVGSSADQGVAEDSEIESHLAKKNRIGILGLFRPKNGEDPNQATDRIGLFLTNQEDNYLPEGEAAQITPGDLDKFGKALMQREQEMATKNKKESPVIDWKVEKTTVSGYMAFVQKIKVKNAGGVAILYDVDIYLPNGRGLTIKSVMDSAEPGAENILRAFAQGIKIAR